MLKTTSTTTLSFDVVALFCSPKVCSLTKQNIKGKIISLATSRLALQLAAFGVAVMDHAFKSLLDKHLNWEN